MAFNALDNGDCSYDQVCLDNGGWTFDCLEKRFWCIRDAKFTCYDVDANTFFIQKAEGYVDSNGQFSALRMTMAHGTSYTLGHSDGMTSVGPETDFTRPIVGVRVWFDDDYIIGQCHVNMLRE